MGVKSGARAVLLAGGDVILHSLRRFRARVDRRQPRSGFRASACLALSIWPMYWLTAVIQAQLLDLDAGENFPQESLL